MADLILDPTWLEVSDDEIEKFIETLEQEVWLPPELLPPEVSQTDIVTNLIQTATAGEPWYFCLFWQHQFLSFNCSVAVQNGILASLGIEITEGELTEIAMREGWLTEDGANIADCGKLLEYYGIETRTVFEGNIDLLFEELQAGNRVIVPLDITELWADTFLERLWEWLEDVLGIADHVVWVTGIDMTDPENPIITVNDTGHPDGAGQSYPLSEFRDAWADAKFSYIATGEALPQAS